MSKHGELNDFQWHNSCRGNLLWFLFILFYFWIINWKQFLGKFTSSGYFLPLSDCIHSFFTRKINLPLITWLKFKLVDSKFSQLFYFSTSMLDLIVIIKFHYRRMDNRLEGLIKLRAIIWLKKQMSNKEEQHWQNLLLGSHSCVSHIFIFVVSFSHDKLIYKQIFDFQFFPLSFLDLT